MQVFDQGFQTLMNSWKHLATGRVLLLFQGVRNPQWNMEHKFLRWLLNWNNKKKIAVSSIWGEIKTMFHLRSKPLRFSSECSLGIKVHACHPIMPHLLAVALMNLRSYPLVHHLKFAWVANKKWIKYFLIARFSIA